MSQHIEKEEKPTLKIKQDVKFDLVPSSITAGQKFESGLPMSSSDSNGKFKLSKQQILDQLINQANNLLNGDPAIELYWWDNNFFTQTKILKQIPYQSTDENGLNVTKYRLQVHPKNSNEYKDLYYIFDFDENYVEISGKKLDSKENIHLQYVRKENTVDIYEITNEKKIKKYNFNLNDMATVSLKVSGLYALISQYYVASTQDNLDSDESLWMNVKHGLEDTIKDSIKDISLDVANILNQNATQIAAKYTTKALNLSIKCPIDIAGYAKKRFNWVVDNIFEEYPNQFNNAEEAKEAHVIKKTMSEMVAQIMAERADNIKEKEEKEEKKKKEKKDSKIKKFISEKIIKKMPEYISNAENFIAEATENIERALTMTADGPGLIQSQIDKIVKDHLIKYEEYLDKGYNAMVKGVEEFEKSVGYWEGQQLVHAYNTGLWLAASSLLWAQKRTSEKTIAKAKAAIDKAKIELMTKLNIELPI